MNDDVPKGVEYRGPMGIARDSIWLTNEDLPHDRDTVVVIESIAMRRDVTFQGGRKKPVVLSARFVGKNRELLLNAGHRKTLAALFENTAAGAWFGKRITLFVEQNIRRADGTFGPAVRIRAKLLEQDAPAANGHAETATSTETENP